MGAADGDAVLAPLAAGALGRVGRLVCGLVPGETRDLTRVDVLAVERVGLAHVDGLRRRERDAADLGGGREAEKGKREREEDSGK